MPAQLLKSPRLSRPDLGDSSQQPTPLRIVAYNAHLLPDIAARVAGKRNNSHYRARSIAERLVGYDILGICEAFDRKHTRTLLNTFHALTEHRYHVVQGPKRSGRHWINGGLLFLSRFPIEATHQLTYRDASRPLTSGFKADGFAAKGALHARLRVGDGSSAVDCFLTHLESQAPLVRLRQIEQLSDFIARHSSSENPVLALGDFNVASPENGPHALRSAVAPYQRLRRKLVHNGKKLIDTWSSFHQEHGGTSDPRAADGGRRIDYIFMSDKEATANACLEPREITTLPLSDGQIAEGSLSDHLAIACQAELRTITNQVPVYPK